MKQPYNVARFIAKSDVQYIAKGKTHLMKPDSLMKHIVIWLIFSFTTTAFAAEDQEMANLRAKSKELEAANFSVTTAKTEQTDLELQLKDAIVELRKRENAKNSARKNYEELNTMDTNRPGTITESALRSARENNQNAYTAYTEQKQKVENLRGKVTIAGNNVEASVEQAERVNRDLTAIAERIIDRKVALELQKMQQPKVVTVTGTASCSDEEALSKCKRRAKANAERKASEEGGMVSINSVTEVENLQISQDLIKSEVSASITNKKTLDEKWAADSTSVWEYKMEATVTPRVSRTFINQLRDNFEREITADIQKPINVSRRSAITGLPSGRSSGSGTGASRQSIEQELNSLSNTADKQIRQKKFFSPIGDNAFETYQVMARLDRDNLSTTSVINSLSLNVSNEVSDRIKRDDIVNARALYDQAKSLITYPESARNQLDIVRNQLNIVERSESSKRQISSLLLAANDFMNRQQYLLPSKKNAYETYNKVLQLDPSNQQARQGLNLLQQRVLRRARTLHGQSRTRQALNLLSMADQRFPQNYLFRQTYKELNDEINKPKSTKKRKLRGIGW
ncbi:MAG: hypothetical protein V2I33_04505 [Kangiellaceae bacterium]|jgi:hypothetical protein|nr:hypothetical protein [Kangiellaceae bacterium]